MFLILNDGSQPIEITVDQVKKIFANQQSKNYSMLLGDRIVNVMGAITCDSLDGVIDIWARRSKKWRCHYGVFHDLTRSCHCTHDTAESQREHSLESLGLNVQNIDPPKDRLLDSKNKLKKAIGYDSKI